MNNKILTLLGFAAKAGKLSFGMDTAVSAIQSSKSRLVVVSGEISAKSQKELTFYADKKGIPVKVFREFDIQTVSKAVGRKCGIISVNDSSFADAVIKAAQLGGTIDE